MAEHTDREMSDEDYFVHTNYIELVNGITKIRPVLEGLLSHGLIDEISYNEIMSLPKWKWKKENIIRRVLVMEGYEKKIVFQLLKTFEPELMEELKKRGLKKTEELKKKRLEVVEILSKLTSVELDEFKFLLELENNIPPSIIEGTTMQDVVELIEKMSGLDSITLIAKILKKMNRTDLIQSSDASRRTKVKQPVDEKPPALIQRKEKMVSVTNLLLETMALLNDKELRDFMLYLGNQVHYHKPHSDIPWSLFMTADLVDTVFLMVQTFSLESVEKTKEILKKMNRTDLVLWLLDSSPEPTTSEQHSVDEHMSALIHKVATMVAVEELLLETLTELNDGDLEIFKWHLQFICFQKGFPYIPWRRIRRADLLAEVMVDMCGQRSVEVTNEILKWMNRTDLVQKLSETSSGLKVSGSSAEVSGVTAIEGEKEERCSALIQKEQTMVSVIELHLETLAELSDSELRDFKQILLYQSLNHKHQSDIPWILLRVANLQDSVFLMVQTYGQESVEQTKMILKRMNKTDLVQRLSDTSSGPTKKLSVDDHCSVLIQKMATMAAVKHLLLENLNDLSNMELQEFKKVLRLIAPPWGALDNSWILGNIDNRTDIVNQIVEIYGWHSVEVTKKVFMSMNKTDLVQRLSETSSSPKEEHNVDQHRAALFERVAAKDAVKHVLLEILNSLNLRDLKKFQWVLQSMYFQKGLPLIPHSQLVWEKRAEMVDMMVERFGQQSVEVIREAFKDMNMTDVGQRLSETSSLRAQHLTSLLQQDLTMIPIKEKLLETLEDLSYLKLKEFKSVLQDTETMSGLQRIPKHPMEMAQRVDVVELMVQTYGEQSVDVTIKVLKNISRHYLIQRLSEISSGSIEGASRSLELDGCGGTMESSNWTKLEPEVNSSDADEPPIYSLQSDAGQFECNVSALRWVCKEKVSLKYQFFSWEEHMERMECLQYMPAGPLMDITVNTGKLDEVYLPHWICIDDDPTMLDKFAVLHIDDCGDVVEKVSEVTPYHIRLSEPVFSPRAALIKIGFPVKTRSYVLMFYKPNILSLKLHVYLIPKDPALQQTVHKNETDHKFENIRTSYPNRSLKMKQDFILTADVDTAKISPKVLTLRYDSDPNFYRVVIANPKKDICLTLSNCSSNEEVWSCEIQKDDYPNAGPLQESPTGPCYGATETGASSGATGGNTMAEGGSTDQHFVDKYQLELINRVTNVDPILDELCFKEVISKQRCKTIRKMSTSCNKIREIYPSLEASDECKDIFYEILTRHEKYLIRELQRKK